jgi:hypothetical protein
LGDVPCAGNEMPAHKINGLPIALDSAFNRIVRYQVAASRSEADEVIGLLPFIVANGLDSELGVCKEAHRYDLDTKRAYCFQLEGDRLHIWIWNEIEDYVEAGNLLSLIVSLEKDLNEELANEVYVRATGRNVNQPHAIQRESPHQAG